MIKKLKNMDGFDHLISWNTSLFGNRIATCCRIAYLYSGLVTKTKKYIKDNHG